MAFIFIFGPTVYILEVYLENISAYVGGVDVLDQLERYLHFIREVGEPLPWEAREEVD